jgi:hypothetical protein
MRLLPTNLAHQFDALLDQKGIDDPDKATYLKWLRFYWDFCHQCHYEAYLSHNLPPFLEKLREQQQSDSQRNQARQAIACFYYLQPISTVTSGVLAPSENLTAVSRNPDGALSSIVVPSKAIVENTATSTIPSPIPASRESKRPSQPDSYNQ